MHGDASSGEALTLRKRSPWLVRLVWLLGVALAATVVAYVATHPDELPTTDGVVTASTPSGRPVFVGVFAAPAGFGRSVHVSGVKVFATAPGPVTITPHLCRGGSVGVTTDPTPFCSEVVPTEGATLRAGDEIVLEVVGDVPGTIAIDRVRIAYRDDFQWATQRAGRPAVVTIL
jgi:hypothetical protein